MTPEQAIELRVTLARIEERQESTTHRLRNMDMKLEAFVTKRDLEAMGDHVAATCGPLDKRLDKIESASAWIVRTIMAAVVAAVAGLFAIAKTGHGL